MNKNNYLCIVLIILLLTIIIVIQCSNSIIKFVKEGFVDSHCILYDDFRTLNPTHQGKIKYHSDGVCRNPCPPGEYVSKEQEKCVKCSINEFSNKINSLQCNTCGQGEITLKKGADKCIPFNSIEAVPNNDEGFNKLKDFAKEISLDYKKINNDLKDSSTFVDNGYNMVLNRFNEINQTNDRIKDLDKKITEQMNILKLID